MNISLGKWAVIDIETTGVSPVDDEIIDIGFLQFEDTTLVRRFESLVRSSSPLSQFIQRLTGITTAMLKHAPTWREVEVEVQSLYGYHLLAHNAGFEEAFLSASFEKIADETPREQYEDSLYILGVIFPFYSSLKLEKFIIDFKLADGEVHRGLADSIDLLKVLLIAGQYVQKHSELYEHLFYLFQSYQFEDNWYFRFVMQDADTLEQIAKTIDFDLPNQFNQIDFSKLYAPTNANYCQLPKQKKFSFDGASISKFFKDEEYVKQFLPNYSFRQSQLDLALKVGQSFKNGIHALIQAPTGTGKTLGYMVPALLKATEQQVLITTGTKTLQQQAYVKDLPVVKKLLGLHDSLKSVKLIGSANHLCQLMFDNYQREVDMLSATDDNYKWASIFLEMVFFFNQQHEQDLRLTRDDLPFVLKQKNTFLKQLEREIRVDFRACINRRCRHYEYCSYTQGLALAKESNVIIANHALMYSWPASFPRPALIVVDEAHRLEQETTSAFSRSITLEDLLYFIEQLQRGQSFGALYYLINQTMNEPENIIANLQQSGARVYQMLADHLTPLQQEIERYFQQRARYSSLYWNEVEFFNSTSQLSSLERSIFNHWASLSVIFTDFYSDVIKVWESMDQGQFDNDADLTAYNRFAMFWARLEDIITTLQLMLEENDQYARTLRFHERDGLELKADPIDIGKIVHDKLLASASSVVMTSATLGTVDPTHAQKGIEWASGYLHLEPARRFKHATFLPSVYNYTEHAKVFLATDVPAMGSKDFVPTILRPVIKLLRSIEGRGLLLFSSRVRFEMAREILLDQLSGKLNLYVQGMGSNVVDDFKQDKHSVLLGMESFAEGIDIPGDALRFVFIDKIPDLRMDLVIRKRQDFFERVIGNSFVEYNLAARTRALHQKLGRLLRTEHDSGGVLIVDSRVQRWKGRTLQQFEELMSPYIIERETLEQCCKKIEDFILQTK